MEAISSAMKTAFATVQTDVTSMITASAPIRVRDLMPLPLFVLYVT